MTANSLTETFEGTSISIMEVGGTKWVRGHDIARALGFADPTKAMEKILARNRAEFDASTTCMIDIHSGGQYRSVRLYNARGAALIAMKAQTPKGEDFRRWVLDVLEGRDDSTPVEAGTNIPPGVLYSLRQLFMGARGNAALVRYVGIGLGTAEIARLLNVRPNLVSSRRRMAEFLGLASEPASLEERRNRANFLKMVEGRERSRANWNAKRRAPALPAPDDFPDDPPPETPEEATRRRDAQTVRIQRANARDKARRENGNG